MIRRDFFCATLLVLEVFFLPLSQTALQISWFVPHLNQGTRSVAGLKYPRLMAQENALSKRESRLPTVMMMTLYHLMAQIVRMSNADLNL